MKINYYGDNDNYIHLKFGDCIKAYNFTNEFMEKYPEFTERYKDYCNNGANKQASYNKTGFASAFEVVAYVFKKYIPVHFYYNFSDTPAKDYDEIIKYLVEENTYISE